MFSHKNKKYSLRKVKNGVASVVIALLFASVTAPVAQARSVVGGGGNSAQVSSFGTTVLQSSGGFGTVHGGDLLLGGSGGSGGSLPGASGDTLPLAGESGSGNKNSQDPDLSGRCPDWAPGCTTENNNIFGPNWGSGGRGNDGGRSGTLPGDGGDTKYPPVLNGRSGTLPGDGGDTK
ncbi:YSIRK-type signal peptide-containing protein, partial [Streptococcus ruminantium]